MPLPAQQVRIPTIGFLSIASSKAFADRADAFRRGLRDTGYNEGSDVLIEYRWANFEAGRLPSMAAELVSRQVSLIAAFGGSSTALAAKSSTTTIPIVFGAVSEDPVHSGLVASLARPGGNITGVVSLGAEIGPKRLELLREVIPEARTVAVLVNLANVADPEAILNSYRDVAPALGLQLHFLDVNSEERLDEAFARLSQLKAHGLVIAPDPFFNSARELIGTLSLRHGVPAIFQFREFILSGGLVSYGANLTEGWHLVGTYAGRILKGEKPADLPVQQATRLHLIVNLKAAKTFGLHVPTGLLVRADEVIE